MGRPKKLKLPDKRDPQATLDLTERFYIENHGEMSVEELARDLGKPVELIRDYITDYLAKHPPVKKAPRTKTLLNRPAKGVVSMTEGASMSGDDSLRNNVSLEAVKRAEASGDHELAADLRKRYEEKIGKQTKDIIKEKYRPIIHYIQSPDDDAEVY